MFHERIRRDKKGSSYRTGYSVAYPRGAERIAMKDNLKIPYGVLDDVVLQFKGICERGAEEVLP